MLMFQTDKKEYKTGEKITIDLTLDYYDMKTTNLLMRRTLPEITGFSSIMSNLGELGNRGFEATLNMININKSSLTWKSSVVLSLNRNKIIKLFGDVGTYTLLGEERTGELPDFSNQWFPGQAIDVIWNYNTIGIWQEEEAEAAAVFGSIPFVVECLNRCEWFSYLMCNIAEPVARCNLEPCLATG